MRVKKSSNWKYVVMMMLAMVLSCSAMTAVTQAATTHTASATTDRKDGVCTYTVKGLDPSRESEFTMELRRSDNKKTMIKKQITINEDNCVKGTYEVKHHTRRCKIHLHQLFGSYFGRNRRY